MPKSAHERRCPANGERWVNAICPVVRPCRSKRSPTPSSIALIDKHSIPPSMTSIMKSSHRRETTCRRVASSSMPSTIACVAVSLNRIDSSFGGI
jgi:hypothetical protein